MNQLLTSSLYTSLVRSFPLEHIHNTWIICKRVLIAGNVYVTIIFLIIRFISERLGLEDI